MNSKLYHKNVFRYKHIPLPMTSTSKILFQSGLPRDVRIAKR